MNYLTPQAIHELKLVRAEILADPETYDQRETCGNCCCIAGHIAHKHGFGRIERMTAVGNFLGITEDQQFELFGGADPRMTRYNPDPIDRARAGARHIDNFIAKYTVPAHAQPGHELARAAA